MKRVISIMILSCLLTLPLSCLGVNASTDFDSNSITSNESIITINSPGGDDDTRVN